MVTLLSVITGCCSKNDQKVSWSLKGSKMRGKWNMKCVERARDMQEMTGDDLGLGGQAADQRIMKDKVDCEKWKEEKRDHKMKLLYRYEKPTV